MNISLEASAVMETLKLIEEDFRAPLAQRALNKAARIVYKRALKNAEAVKETGLLARYTTVRGKKKPKNMGEVFAGVGVEQGREKVERVRPARGRTEHYSHRYSAPSKYAHLVEGGVPKYSIAPRPLYAAAYTASLHDIEQEISKTIHKGLEVAIKKGKAKRAAAPPGQALLAL